MANTNKLLKEQEQDIASHAVMSIWASTRLADLICMLV